MPRLLSDIDAAGNWRFGLGDNSPAGWIITLAYFATLGVCIWAWRREDERWLAGIRGLRPRFWLVLSIAMLILGVNKQLDLQTLISVVGRRVAKSMGWYDQRREVQVAFIVIVGLLAVGSVVITAWWIRSAWRRYWLAVIGAAYLAFFVVVRAAAFHHVDQFLFNLPGLGRWTNRLLEFSGILLIAVGGIKTILSEPRRTPEARPRPL